MNAWKYTDASNRVAVRANDDGGMESVLAEVLIKGTEILPADPLVPTIPQVVTMRQARLALLGAGLLDSVIAAIAAIPDTTQRRAAEIEWEYAATVDRASPFTQQLASGLGLTSEQLDGLFTQAAAL